MTDTNIRTSVKYFTQRRISYPGQPGEFEKCCTGHTELYDAVSCAEIARAALAGERDRHDASLETKAMDAQIHANFLALLAAGCTIELRVAKFTVTRETVEDLGFITAEKVQPKKEVP